MATINETLARLIWRLEQYEAKLPEFYGYDYERCQANIEVLRRRIAQLKAQRRAGQKAA